MKIADVKTMEDIATVMYDIIDPQILTNDEIAHLIKVAIPFLNVPKAEVDPWNFMAYICIKRCLHAQAMARLMIKELVGLM